MPSPFALRPAPCALRLALRLAFPVGLTVPAVAHAGEHPLRVEGNAAEALVKAGYSTEDAVRAVVVFTGIDIDEEGNVTRHTGAELPDVEGESSAGEPVGECAAAALPLMDAGVERFLDEAMADEVAQVSFLVAARIQPTTFGMAWAYANLESPRSAPPDPIDVRWDVAEAQREARAGDLALLVAAIVAAGGEVEEVAALSGTVEARVSPAQLAEVMMLPEVTAVEVPAAPADELYSWTTPGWSEGDKLNGEEIEEIIQTRILYRHPGGPYLGAGVGMGITETAGGELYLFHEAWEDGYEVSRVSNCDWSSGSCVPYVPSVGGPHSTAVASVMVGDLTLGQDPSVLTVYGQRKRSGIARAATLVGINSGSRATVEDWATTAFQGSLINQSSNPAHVCTANTDWARTVNAIYESGIGWFNSMGNEGHGFVGDCTAGSAASALGAFAVSAISWWDDGGTSYDMYTANSRGGTGSSPADGRSRAIVGIAAPTMFEYPYIFAAGKLDCAGQPLTYGTDWTHTSECGPEAIGHTSGASPVVAGAAAVFKEYFLDAYNSFIEDPGALYTNLLLMGDRRQISGHAVPFDNLWGAGALRLRAFDAHGLDNAGGWSTGALCVDTLTTVTLPDPSSPNSGQAVGTTADYLKVVSWWYDRRVDDGIFSHDHDNVDLRVVRTDASGSQTYNSELDDNRQRVTVASSVGGSSFDVKFIGRDVTADDEGCGANSMRVYWAWMYEDSARDDTDTDLDGETVMDYTRVEP